MPSQQRPTEVGAGMECAFCPLGSKEVWLKNLLLRIALTIPVCRNLGFSRCQDSLQGAISVGGPQFLGFTLRMLLYQAKIREQVVKSPLATVTSVMFLRKRRNDPAPVLEGTGGTAAVLPHAVNDFLSFTSAADLKCMVLPFLCPGCWRGQEKTASSSMAQNLWLRCWWHCCSSSSPSNTGMQAQAPA